MKNHREPQNWSNCQKIIASESFPMTFFLIENILT